MILVPARDLGEADSLLLAGSEAGSEPGTMATILTGFPGSLSPQQGEEGPLHPEGTALARAGSPRVTLVRPILPSATSYGTPRPQRRQRGVLRPHEATSGTARISRRRRHSPCRAHTASDGLFVGKGTIELPKHVT